METLKFLCIGLLSVLLLKNLGIIQWQDSKPSVDFEGTRDSLVDTIKGEADGSGE